MSQSDFKRQRKRLIEHELRSLGIRDEAVLHAMRKVPREEFVSEGLREFAYRNTPLPIESGQTISQPLIVASMTEALALTPDERVLEIGTGSGYSAAVLSQLAREVFTVERHRELALTAEERLRRLGYDNVHVLHADGTRGWPEKAPFDAIVVAAGSPDVPRPLLEQLREGGRLVIPAGETRDSQRLVRVVRRDGEFEYEPLTAVRFVPLIGEAGWQEEEDRQRTSVPPPARKRRPGLPEINSAKRSTRSGKAPITGRSPPRRTGKGRRKSNAYVQPTRTVTNTSCTYRRWTRFFCRSRSHRTGS